MTQLEDIEVGPAEKSFLIRSEDAKYVIIVLRLFCIEIYRRSLLKTCQGGDNCCTRDHPCGEVS